MCDLIGRDSGSVRHGEKAAERPRNWLKLRRLNKFIAVEADFTENWLTPLTLSTIRQISGIYKPGSPSHVFSMY